MIVQPDAITAKFQGLAHVSSSAGQARTGKLARRMGPMPAGGPYASAGWYDSRQNMPNQFPTTHKIT